MESNLVKLPVRRALCCMTVAALFALASPVSAQTTSRLIGTVVDAQGAVLPGVTVTATSPQLQGANTTVTDASGQFRFPSVPPGVYTVKAELSGFKAAEQSDVRVAVDQTLNVSLKMQVAGVAETINVM